MKIHATSSNNFKSIRTFGVGTPWDGPVWCAESWSRSDESGRSSAEGERRTLRAQFFTTEAEALAVAETHCAQMAADGFSLDCEGCDVTQVRA